MNQIVLQIILFISIMLFSTKIITMQRALQLRTFPKKAAQPLSKTAREIIRLSVQPVKFVPTPHCKRLIILIDPEEDETFSADPGALRLTIFSALKSKVAPLLITKDLVTGMCHGKEVYEWEKNLSSTKKPVSADKRNYANQTAYAVSLIPTSNNWFCYAHKTTGLLLLIPNVYSINKDPRSSTYATELGFDINNLDVVDNSSAKTLLEYIENHKTTYTDIPQAIESMLIHHKEQKEIGLPESENISSPWIIYLMGHGMTIEYPALHSKKDNLTKQIYVYEQKIVDYQKELERESDEKKRTEREEEINNKLRLISVCQNKIKEIEENLTKDIEENILRNKEGLIAGLPTSDFFKLMSIFSNKIRTFFLHYTSCYATGFNQMIINRVLSKINVDFIVSTQGMTEGVAYAPSQPFGEIFQTLDKFFYDTISFTSTKLPRTAPLKDPLQKIMSTLITIDQDDRFRTGLQPFIRLPKIGIFKAIGIDNKVKILTNAKAVARQLENVAIDYTNKEIIAIMVYPQYVAAPLHINGSASIVSPTPDNLENRDKNIHVFEKVSYNNSLFQMLLNLPKFNQSYYNTIFVIKELHCFDEENSGLGIGKDVPIILKDVVICTQLKDKSDLKSSLDVMFTHNDTQYLFFNGIIFGKIFGGGMGKPYLTDNNPTLLLATAETKNRFLSSLFGKEMVDLDTDSANFVPSLIKKLQKKINMPVTAQAETGALKKVLEKHLESIAKKGE